MMQDARCMTCVLRVTLDTSCFRKLYYENVRTYHLRAGNGDGRSYDGASREGEQEGSSE